MITTGRGGKVAAFLSITVVVVTFVVGGGRHSVVTDASGRSSASCRKCHALLNPKHLRSLEVVVVLLLLQLLMLLPAS